MGTVKLQGIVIGEKQKGESSKQILVLAKGLGRVWLSAKGAQNTKSKLLAGTQLFSYCDFLAFEGRGFYALTQVDLLESFYNLRLDMAKLAEAVYLVNLVEATCPAGMEQDDTLYLLLTTLTMLEKTELAPRLISRIFEIKYLQHAGVLSLDGCMVCEGRMEPLYFERHSGMFLCGNHKRGREVLPAVAQALGFVMEKEGRHIFGFGLSEEALTQLDALLERYIEVHMQVTLKSRAFGKLL